MSKHLISSNTMKKHQQIFFLSYLGALAMEASNMNDCVNMILSMGEDKLDFKPPPRFENNSIF